ncbi:MAG TPA: serine/threonine-protein kinase [Anaeromyxobacter sp.]
MTPVPFGRFLLLERVAIGGMAEVYAAVEQGDRAGTLRAVKRILPTLAEERDLVRLFLDEARIAVQLDHPGLVPVHELGKLSGTYYIAMDYVAGRDLRAIAALFRGRREPVPLEFVARVVADAADALDHAHRGRGADGAVLEVVHRDVSPANVLVGFDGRVRVIDFGIAQATRGRGTARSSVLRGKFGYMSPELVRGLPVDRRSDVFALGIVLHELLAGERLFTGPTELAVMERVRAADVRPPSATNPRVPPELDRLVLRALAREPEDRFAWANELSRALRPWARKLGAGRPGVLAGLMARWFPEELRREQERRARAAAHAQGVA